ncbi:uncharacterized protein EAF01_004487 [Botrytis porri]|uniref:Celp0028 effector like protein n=1 Tax=Botrytis porri TaxID=87229 RepID=A0A4Z1KVX0_9HELO|nr:uncharacterized protein EAF01_004487 [Botrytis porri]KAF7908732.1 hypothetical protein EAF01_004487 [Botrytis porri]TGO88661.1 hypothetical protein BPOR_0149g00150 [Botrytis porri]
MYITSLLSSLLLSSTIVGAATVPRHLDESKIILFGQDGRTEIMDKAEFWKLHHGSDITQVPAPLVGYNGTSGGNPPSSVAKRGCKSNSVIRENPDKKFLNWDVPMSSVVKAGTTTSTVAVTQGYSIANSIAVSEGATFTLIKDYLQTNYGITYTDTWTSTYTAAYTYTVPAGKYGAVVSNPYTLRKSGYVDTGCIGQPSDTSTYQADSYSSQAFGGLSWVSGTISLCTGNTYPLPRCIGSGTLN